LHIVCKFGVRLVCEQHTTHLRQMDCIQIGVLPCQGVWKLSWSMYGTCMRCYTLFLQVLDHWRFCVIYAPDLEWRIVILACFITPIIMMYESILFTRIRLCMKCKGVLPDELSDSWGKNLYPVKQHRLTWWVVWLLHFMYAACNSLPLVPILRFILILSSYLRLDFTCSFL
jgi:hypothetical protein